MTDDAADPAESERAEQARDPGRGAEAAETDGEFDFDAAGDAPADEEAERRGGVDADAAGDPAGDLVDRVADHDEELAAEVDELADRVAELESELTAVDDRLREREERVEELETKLKRKQAEFQNYKKRQKKRREEIKERATEEFVSQVVSVRDNLVRALDQDEGADIRGGLESTLEEFDRLLDAEGVAVIDPEPGSETDPQRHEVMMRVESDRPEGTVADVYQPGYEMGDRVIRAAQVTVSEGDGE
jgi:molecular chaperone GrpE